MSSLCTLQPQASRVTRMLNISKVQLPLQLPTFSRSSDRLLQPLWDYFLFNHYFLISSPFFPVILCFSSYFFSSLPFAVLDLLGDMVPSIHHYKIQQERRPTMGMMAKSFGRAVYNHLIFVLPAVLTQTCFMPSVVLPSSAPTVVEVLIDGLAALLLFDTQYYMWHFVHHKHPQLYRWVHAIHHEYMAPFSWNTQQLSIPELITLGFWSNLDPILLKCHPFTTWCVTIISVWMSVEDHIGYDLPWGLNHLVPFGLLGGAPAHDMHHQKPNSNYAPFFSHWDRLFGTAILPGKITEKKVMYSL
ncbi:cholesterol 25-hydroxylase-like protein 1, member 1 [Oncorhynchus tshawytscha]|uniref:cholesterol 25-hydroxylase-like protein 1, member 1 n=1 Tax=Oncorhynchus tshawytscha TaxID=74940 RepID=UPI000D09C7C3|nr:cholesterol 25-hydroxylase-like protein 1, member 1 [Oncorhynchus tshawytscha]